MKSLPTVGWLFERRTNTETHSRMWWNSSRKRKHTIRNYTQECDNSIETYPPFDAFERPKATPNPCSAPFGPNQEQKHKKISFLSYFWDTLLNPWAAKVSSKTPQKKHLKFNAPKIMTKWSKGPQNDSQIEQIWCPLEIQKRPGDKVAIKSADLDYTPLFTLL